MIKCIYNWFSGLKVSCSLFVIEEKNLGSLFLVESFKREMKYKSFHISLVILSSCGILATMHMAPWKPGELSLLSHLGKEQSLFHLLAQREMSIICMGEGTELCLIPSLAERGWRKEALALLLSVCVSPSCDGHCPGSSLRQTKYPWDSQFSRVRKAPLIQGLFWQLQFSSYGW